MATLRGEQVDRPPVSFYELNGMDQDPDDDDPFNIFNHPSWRPLIDLAKEKTDRIVLRGVAYSRIQPDPIESISKAETFMRDGNRFTRRRIQIGSRTLTSLTQRDPAIDTIWTVEPLLKDVDDLKAFLEIPESAPTGAPDTEAVVQTETALGDTGIVMIDTPDPLCLAAALFDMADYTVIAMTEQPLFHRLLDRFASELLPKTEAVANALPGRLWRIFGPDICSGSTYAGM
jgi:hypothetical protein